MRVYIAGAVTEHPDPKSVREGVKRSDPTGKIEWIDPLDYEAQHLSPEEIIDTDIDLINNCDAVFLYWQPEMGSWGSAAEIYHANQIAGIPVVTWRTEKLQEDTREVPTWVEGLSESIHRDAESAAERIVEILG